MNRQSACFSMFIAGLISLFLLLPLTSKAQSGTISLNDLLEHSSLNSPAIKAAYERYQSLSAQARLVGGLPNPVIGYGHFLEQVETRVGPQERKFSVKQTIPWFGLLGAKSRAASLRADKEYQSYLMVTERVRYAVRAAYYDYLLLVRQIELTEQNVQLLRFWESVVRTKYKVGLSGHPDLIKGQVELGKLENQLESLKQKQIPLKAKLEAAANMTIADETDISPVSSLGLDLVPLNSDSVVTAILAGNPDLLGMERLIEASEAGVTVASRANRPTFMLGVDYIQTGEALNPAMTGSGNDPLIVSVGLSIPIWFGKNKARTQSARAMNNSVRYQKEEAANQLKAFVKRVLFEYSDGLRQINLYRDDLLNRAEMAVDASFTAYENGKVGFISLLDAQRQLLAFQLELDRAVTSAVKSKAKLEMLGGTNISTAAHNNL